MPHQMSRSLTVEEKRTGEFLEILRPGRLSSLDARQVLLYSARFPSVEAHFREISSSQGAQPHRISVLSTLSAEHFISIFKLFLYSEAILPDFNVAGFDGIATEGLDPASPFWRKVPDSLLIMPAVDDIKSWPPLFASDQEIQSWVRINARRYLDVWQHVTTELAGCRIYQALFAPPLERPLGNLERRYPFSRTSCLASLNSFLVEHAPVNVTLVDFDALSGTIGRQQWNDEAAYFTSKQPFSIRQMPLVAANLSRLIAAAQGKVRKCLVLDLDNTLWGGVIGDDGVEGIRLDPNDATGEAFLAFQRYVLQLKERGILLAVCSKNDTNLARAAIEQHPDMILRMDDFVAFVANWDDKATNLRRIAGQLNIGIDSLVFFDDNPAERSLVRQFEPEVFVVEVPEDPALYVRALDLSFAFEWQALTIEDLGRSESYVHDRMRQDLANTASDYDSYLRSLEMQVSFEATVTHAIERVCQLVNKTNQFNLRTRRYSPDELSTKSVSPNYNLIHVRLRDRFSNYGIIASVVIAYHDDIAFIENWVMSCRVFKRGVEDATFNAIIDAAKARGAVWLVAEYVQTEKNGYVANLLEMLGMARYDKSADCPQLPENVSKGLLFIQSLTETTHRSHFLQPMNTTER
jgi:FkbH-like protein